MRVRVRQNVSRTQPFNFYYQDYVVPVFTVKRDRRVSRAHYELSWTWPGCSEFSVLLPVRVASTKEGDWLILKGRDAVCCGSKRNPSAKDAILKNAIPRIAWQTENYTIIDQLKCCGGELRSSSGELVAVWRLGWRATIVCRYQTAEELQPVLGMVLARLFDPEVPD
jgi:hypothetical protein